MKEPAKTHRFMGSSFFVFLFGEGGGKVCEIRVARMITGGYLAPPSWYPHNTVGHMVIYL